MTFKNELRGYNINDWVCNTFNLGPLKIVLGLGMDRFVLKRKNETVIIKKRLLFEKIGFI